MAAKKRMVYGKRPEARSIPTLEECKRALDRRTRPIIGENGREPPKTVPTRLLAWAVREIERLRDPEIFPPSAETLERYKRVIAAAELPESGIKPKGSQ